MAFLFSVGPFLRDHVRIARAIALLLVTLAGCMDPSDSMPRSLVQLLANPERFDGHYVTTGGFLLYDPRGMGHLYLTKDDAEYGVDYNSILVVPDDIDEIYLPLEDFQARFVIVDGKFVRNYPNGKIEEVTRIVAFEPRGLSDCRYRPRPWDQPDICGPPMVDRGYKGPK